ncbi:MAG: AbrB/MazE/SpoVT family DNA-binding domain-containing protein [Oscillospiraceae bacterium]|jgi:antitoxin MazE|nr:AbrB/MazE/SpoVT family DNA-binding domain-containing protein [Oscillospiraceae bacterium]
MTTTVQKWGNSQGVRLPKVILEELFIKENDRVDIIVNDNSIVIKKATRKRRAKKSLEERFENYNGDYKCSEYDWGKPTGKEVW